MWTYEKKLQHPVKIKTPNAAAAKVIITQLGGPDGELAASTRYLTQRFSMPYKDVKGILTDVGTEVPNLRKDIYQPLILANSQRTTDSGYIEVSKWRFSFKGKEGKRSCEVSPIHGNKKTPKPDAGTLLVRVLLGIDR